MEKTRFGYEILKKERSEDAEKIEPVLQSLDYVGIIYSIDFDPELESGAKPKYYVTANDINLEVAKNHDINIANFLISKEKAVSISKDDDVSSNPKLNPIMKHSYLDEQFNFIAELYCLDSYVKSDKRVHEQNVLFGTYRFLIGENKCGSVDMHLYNAIWTILFNFPKNI